MWLWTKQYTYITQVSIDILVLSVCLTPGNAFDEIAIIKYDSLVGIYIQTIVSQQWWFTKLCLILVLLVRPQNVLLTQLKNRITELMSPRQKLQESFWNESTEHKDYT